MLKDKSKLLVLGAIVALFVVLANGGFNIQIGHFQLFHWRPIFMIALIAAAVWFFCNGGCIKACCSHEGDEDEADVAEDAAEGDEDKA